MFDRKQTKTKSVPKRRARTNQAFQQTKRKPITVYTKDSGADQPQTKRRSSADQWQCIQKELRRPTADQAQTKRRPMAVYTQDIGADQPQTKRRPSADQWQCTQRVMAQTNRRPSADQWCYGAIGLVSFQKPFVTGVSFEASQSSHKTIRGAASINLTLIIKNSTTR